MKEANSFPYSRIQQFLKAVQAGVAAVMCSYNQVNGTYSCENSHTLNDLLKVELGFQGCTCSLLAGFFFLLTSLSISDVTTDWWVNQPKYGTEAANQGLDVSCSLRSRAKELNMIPPAPDGYARRDRCWRYHFLLWAGSSECCQQWSSPTISTRRHGHPCIGCLVSMFPVYLSRTPTPFQVPLRARFRLSCCQF